MKVYDAIVAGGGVAGAAVAIHLARDGYEVLLLEKHDRPHHKVCGEFISHQAVQLLSDLGLDLDQLQAPFVREARIYSRNRVAAFPLPAPCRALSRKRLDHELLNLCESSRVTVQRGSTVVSVSHDSPRDKAQATSECAVATQTDIHYGRSLFLATGKLDLRNYYRRPSSHSSLSGVKIHVRLAPDRINQLRNQVHLYGLTAGFAGLTLVENDIANLCLLLHNRQLGQIGTDWLRLHTYLREENHQLGNILHSAEPCMEKPICVSNIPYGFVRDATSTHCYCLGDQYAVIPSATGRGLFIALLTGKEAAKYFRLRGTEGTRAYNETLNKALKGRVKGVRWIDESLQQPKRFALIVSLANRFPSVAQWIARQGSLV